MMEYVHDSQDEMESLALDEPSGFMDRRSSESNAHSILDPPSYADAIFMSFDSSSSSANRSPKFGSSSDPEEKSSGFLKIWVSEPQKEQDLYYTYLITTSTDLPVYGGPGSEFSIRRRFRDVVALSDRLAESYKGFFIPVRPDKGVVESQMMQTEQFVEQRRAALDKYLKKLAAHPVIRKSEELRAFLVVQGSLQVAKSAEEAAVVAREESEVAAQGAWVGGRDLFRVLREFRQSVVNDWGRVKPMVVEEDKEFLERKEWWVEFEQHLSNLSLQVLFTLFFVYGFGFVQCLYV